MCIEYMFVSIIRLFPDQAVEPFFGKCLSRAGCEQGKNIKFCTGQVQDCAGCLRGAPGKIDFEVPQADDIVVRRAVVAHGAPDMGPDARRQFYQGKRLYDIVIGPGIESHGFIGIAVSGCDNNNRERACLPDGADDFHAAYIRQHEINQGERVIRAGRKCPDSTGAVRKDVSRKIFAGEIVVYHAADGMVVFDN